MAPGPIPLVFKERGFFGAKVPFPYGPADGRKGLRRMSAPSPPIARRSATSFPLMVDCLHVA